MRSRYKKFKLDTLKKSDKSMVKRINNNSKVVLGIVDKRLGEFDDDEESVREGSLYLETLIFALHLRRGLTAMDKDVFLKNMESMYNKGQKLKSTGG